MSIIKAFIDKALNAPLYTAQPHARGRSISLKWMPGNPPSSPGVYIVYRLHQSRGIPFYVGEARNLKVRLKFLFRCNSGKNPHPSEKCYQASFGAKPDVHIFCKQFGVRFLDTSSLIGRLEIEEELQEALGTNHKGFYEGFSQSGATP